MNFAIYYKGMFKMCDDTKNSYKEGYFLYGETSKFVGNDVYESKYSTNYPKANKVLVFDQNILDDIMSAANKGMNVGFIYGKKIQCYNNEELRVHIIDYIPLKCINFQYTLEGENLKKYKDLFNQRIIPIGKYKVGNSIKQNLSPLDNTLIKSISLDQIYCIISNREQACQKAFLKQQNNNEEIGVFVNV